MCVYKRNEFCIFDSVKYNGYYSIINMNKQNKMVKDIRNIKTAKYIVYLVYNRKVPIKKKVDL